MKNTVPPLDKQQNRCEFCSVKQICLPDSLCATDLSLLENLVSKKRQIERGELLFKQGQKLQYLYAIRSGSCKSYLLSSQGDEQITNFYLTGELIGIDGIANALHTLTVSALETSSVCLIPYEQLMALSIRIPSLNRQVIHMICKQANNHLEIINQSARQRMVTFLAHLSHRYEQRGYSATSFRLPMSRHDIANYLGLANETVSRLFNQLKTEKLIDISKKDIIIHDLQALKAHINPYCLHAKT